MDTKVSSLEIPCEREACVEAYKACPYCGETLATIKGSSAVNGLHGECAKLADEQMNRVLGPICYYEE